MPRSSRSVIDGIGVVGRIGVDRIGTVARLGLATVFLVAGTLKVLDPAQTRIAVRAYQLLPTELVGPVATTLPLVELALGTLLVVGAYTRWVALASTVLLLMLMTAVAQAWARGLAIDCGCFGGGGAVAKSSTHYPQELARDVGMLLLALWLLVRPRTSLSVDRWLRADPGVALSPAGKGDPMNPGREPGQYEPQPETPAQ